MHISAHEVTEAALALSEDERAKLADRLVESLDGELDPSAGAAWATEIERRLARHESGKAVTIPMEEAIARIRRAALGR